MWNLQQRLKSEEGWEAFGLFAYLSLLLDGECYRCCQDVSLASESCFSGLSTGLKTECLSNNPPALWCKTEAIDSSSLRA